MPPKTRRSAKTSNTSAPNISTLKNPGKRRTDSVVGEILKESRAQDQAEHQASSTADAELTELLHEESEMHASSTAEPAGVKAMSSSTTTTSSSTKRKAPQKPLDKPSIKTSKAAKLLSPESEEATPTPASTPVPLSTEFVTDSSADMDVTPTPTPTPVSATNPEALSSIPTSAPISIPGLTFSAQSPAPSSSKSPTPIQLMKFLLSDAVLQLCSPEDEFTELMDSRIGQIRTWHDIRQLSPFEELLGAVILSHPLPHSLGMRTIRTLLNPPYSLTTPEAVELAGRDKVTEALEKAHFSHEEGLAYASEVQTLADEILTNDWASDLSRLRALAGSDVEEERTILCWGIRGLECPGLDIFNRRIQGHWAEAFPFVDPQAKTALEALGLPGDAHQLERLLRENWDAVAMDLGLEDGIAEERERFRRSFVDIVQRAVSLGLEGNGARAMEAARSM